MKKEAKLFAFKLADQHRRSGLDRKWKAREGVSLAGCTDPTDQGIWNDYYNAWGQPVGVDQGLSC